MDFCQMPRAAGNHADPAGPARLSVGQALLDGAPAFCRIRVPAASYTSYCLSYAWSPYAETFAR